jgi:prevent-host-death family protein
MGNVTDVHSLTEFQRNARSLIGKVKKSKNPLLLTVNGRPEVVVQDAEVYQAMVERLQEMEDLVAIREGLAQAEAGNARPAREVFAEWSPSGTGLATG